MTQFSAGHPLSIESAIMKYIVGGSNLQDVRMPTERATHRYQASETFVSCNRIDSDPRVQCLLHQLPSLS